MCWIGDRLRLELGLTAGSIDCCAVTPCGAGWPGGPPIPCDPPGPGGMTVGAVDLKYRWTLFRVYQRSVPHCGQSNWPESRVDVTPRLPKMISPSNSTPRR